MRFEVDSPDPLAPLRARGRVRVGRIAREEDSPAALALFGWIARERRVWTQADWIARLKVLDKCTQTVAEYLTCPTDWLEG